MGKQGSLPLLKAASLAVLAAGLATGAPARGETLADAIALAYQTNPVLAADRASQRALDETYVQARAGFEPTVGLQGTVTTDENNSPYGGVNGVTGMSQTSGAAITVTQPLYTGGRVTAQLSAAEAGVLAGRESLRSAEQTLIQNVIGAYVDVRRDAESVAIARANLDLLRRQLEESQARFDVGEVTRTDVAQTQAQVAAAEAQLSSAQAVLASSRSAYAAVVGHSPENLAPEPSLERLLPATVEAAFGAAEHENPQVLQSQFSEKQSQARLAAARAQTRPTLSLQGSFGYTGGTAGTGNPFVNYSHDASATAVATWPLFTGGLTSSQIRQAAENNSVDRIGLETTRRQVLLATSRAWNGLLGARAALVSGEAQVKAANIAFEGTRQEAQVGLRSTLDVLITAQNLANAQLSLVNARRDEYVAAAALLVAMGSLLAKNLAPGAELYDTARNFDQVKSGVGWTPWTPVVAGVDKVAAPSGSTPLGPPLKVK